MSVVKGKIVTNTVHRRVSLGQQRDTASGTPPQIKPPDSNCILNGTGKFLASTRHSTASSDV